MFHLTSQTALPAFFRKQFRGILKGSRNSLCPRANGKLNCAGRSLSFSRSLAELAGRSFQKNRLLGSHKDIPIFSIAGETVYASTKKATSGGSTLGRRIRRGHASALSSSSTASDRSETVFPDEHTRMHLTNGKRTLPIFMRTHVIILLACVISSSSSVIIRIIVPWRPFNNPDTLVESTDKIGAIWRFRSRDPLSARRVRG